MTTIQDGGPAFPVQDGSKWQCHGMSLRDYAAIKFAAALISTSGEEPDYEEETVAESAYKMADAMLRARSKT